MQIARVIGDLTATQKHASHAGRKILLVQPLHLDGSDRGTPVVALDAVDAGIGDRVLLVQDGYAAFSAMGLGLSPIDAAVLGVIDHVELDTETLSGAAASARQAAAPKKLHQKKKAQNH
jgi:ethanolamine utilization protein EutN